MKRGHVCGSQCLAGKSALTIVAAGILIKVTPHTLLISGKGKKTKRAARMKKLYNTLTRSKLTSSVQGGSHCVAPDTLDRTHIT